ncbi:hypothetical protein HYS82_01305, partial [Candidatus Amesbacteria bacterium]|nr:hypothetical protein [Candidatus Amesbacteria bacterium]
MQFYLGWMLAAFGVTMGLIVPFINLLFRLKFLRKEETGEVRKNASANFYKIRELHAGKAGTPTGGGVLVASVVLVMCAAVLGWLALGKNLFSGHPIGGELAALFVTFGGFAVLGFYDDLIKIFGFARTGFFGMGMKPKFVLQWVVGLGAAAILYFWLGIEFVNVP